MQDIDNLGIIDKLSRILATLNDDIHKNKLAHQQEIEQLQKIIKEQQQEIDRLKDSVHNIEESRKVKKISMDDGGKSKPLFARKRSAIVAQLNVEIAHPPKTIYPATAKNKPLNSCTSWSFIFNSKQKMVEKNTSQDKYKLRSSRDQQARSKAKEEVTDKKYYGLCKKIEIKNKENKEPAALESKTPLSSSTSRGKLVKLFHKGQESIKKKLKKDQSQLICSKGSQNSQASSYQQTKFINVYIPSKVSNERREWR